MKFAIKESDNYYKYYFKDLTTIVGDKLPIFSTAPFLVAVPENASQIAVTNITRDYFEIVLYSSIDKIDTAKFNVMISQK